MNPETGEIKKVGQAHFIRLPGSGPFAFAGLMAWWAPADGAPMLSCSIITKEAERPAVEVHSRMPVVLPKGAESVWLNAAQTDGKTTLAEALVHAVTALEHYPASTRVNNAMNEGAELIEPFERE